MHHNWQDRANKKHLVGFTVTFQDGTVQNIKGGTSGIPDEVIREHGHVKKAIAIEEE
jgi:hypothetical protein